MSLISAIALCVYTGIATLWWGRPGFIGAILGFFVYYLFFKT